MVASWISSGFSHRVLRRGPLPEDIEYEEEDESDALNEEEADALLDVDTFFALYDAEQLDGVLRYADSVLEETPHAPTAWGVKSLVYLIRGRWDEAAKLSAQAVHLSACRALAAPQVLLPLAEDDLGGALAAVMDNLSLRLRSATPPLPLALPGYPSITPREGELLDQIEHNTWRMAEEVLGDMEAEDEHQQLQRDLVAALLAPNPAMTLKRIEEMMPRLAITTGLRASACVALARWRRHEGELEAATRWLEEGLSAMPGLSYARQERQRLRRDQSIAAQDAITLRGYGVTIEVSREDRLLHHTFTPDDGSSVQSMTRWIDDPRPNAGGRAIRDAALAWLEAGFSLLESEPDAADA